MDFWTHRIALARLGWHTEVRLNRNGIASSGAAKRALGIWARRNDWAGWRSEVSFHTHVIVDPSSPSAPDNALQAMKELCEICARATRDYPESIPCQMTERMRDGRLVLACNSWHSDLVADLPRDTFPTELIPEGIEMLRPAPRHAYLRLLFDLGSSGLETDDTMHTFLWPHTQLRDCKDRKWAYKVRVHKRELDGIKLASAPRSLEIERIDEIAGVALLSCAGAMIEAQFAPFKKGGALEGATPNGLPPGDLTLQEKLG